jgi:hypothetical protein
MNFTHLAFSFPLAFALVLPLAGCSKTTKDEATAEPGEEEQAAPKHADKSAKHHAATKGKAAAEETEEAVAPQPVAHAAQQPAAQQPAAPAAAPPAAEAPNPYPPIDQWGRAVDGLPSEIPPPAADSKPPTVAEWNAVPKEITVKNSSKYHCETKMLREWLRVSCHTFEGVQPVSCRTLTQSGQQAYPGFFGDRTSNVIQVIRGKEYTSEYTWNVEGNTVAEVLHVSWPSDQPRPQLYFSE